MAEPSLLLEGVDLDDDPVDLIVELVAPPLPIRAGLGNFVDGLDATCLWIRPESTLT
jgi:hypothetical protein